MMLPAIILILLLGGFFAWLAGQQNPVYAKWICFTTLLIESIVFIILCSQVIFTSEFAFNSDEMALVFHQSWIPQWGIAFKFAFDGLSLVLIALTLLLGWFALSVSWNDITEKLGFYYLNFLWILAGIIGVFIARDLFLFYFFWEMMLVPMYFLISIWGHARRKYAAYKFFIYTQLGGLFMLISILSLYFIHGQQTTHYTFDFDLLLYASLNSATSKWIFSGFLIAFLIKLPVIPLHNWLPDAHTEAPTAGSVILAGLLLKTGAYGLLRFVIPLFPDLLNAWSFWGMLLGAISIIYGAKMAFSQKDLKKLVAYTSVSHMGFVILGIFSVNQMAYQGVIIQLLAHGLSTGALFILVGMLQHRTGTRQIEELSGLWQKAPYMSGFGLVLLMASLGLPGLANFIAEFFILAGAFTVHPWLSCLAALGLVFSAVYALRMLQGVFYGKIRPNESFSDLSLRESIIMTVTILLLIFMGL
ncbi:MAG: NADH-quinone oxidoreductase subunit M, partial [Fulvivirga sp.]|nr:NADH-quinone oxidoreductase subunit M [Fulvivirga sp.]